MTHPPAALRSSRRAAALLAAALTAALAVPAATAAPASAATAGCAYPYVCLYTGESLTGRFKDITDSWQTLTTSRGAEYATNTRHDDGALLHFTDNTTYCLAPGSTVLLVPRGTVDRLRITDSPACRT